MPDKWIKSTGDIPNGKWCWVTDGESEWVAKYDGDYWTNDDCWWDYEGCVIAYSPINEPPEITDEIKKLRENNGK